MFGDWGWNGARTKKQECEYIDWQLDIVRGIKLAIIEIGKYFKSF